MRSNSLLYRYHVQATMVTTARCDAEAWIVFPQSVTGKQSQACIRHLSFYPF